jgi:hypothetical protein
VSTNARLASLGGIGNAPDHRKVRGRFLLSWALGVLATVARQRRPLTLLLPGKVLTQSGGQG